MYPPLLLAPEDTVLVACADMDGGAEVVIDGTGVILPGRVGLGHKLARRDLAVGDVVIKYGAPIGSITVAVARGGHVHTHNMKSDYIPTFGEETAARFQEAME